jgi:hypothetical protein
MQITTDIAEAQSWLRSLSLYFHDALPTISARPGIYLMPLSTLHLKDQFSLPEIALVQNVEETIWRRS